jgi:hypothetical protein
MAGDAKLMGFYTAYKDVFDAVKTALGTKSSIKSGFSEHSATKNF